MILAVAPTFLRTSSFPWVARGPRGVAGGTRENSVFMRFGLKTVVGVWAAGCIVPEGLALTKDTAFDEVPRRHQVHYCPLPPELFSPVRMVRQRQNVKTFELHLNALLSG